MPGAIGGSPHDPVESVDLADEMALADAADRGIAGHLADRVQPMREKQCPSAHACGRSSGFAAGMTATHDDHVVRLVHLLSDAELPEDRVEYGFHADGPGDTADRAKRQAQILAP